MQIPSQFFSHWTHYFEAWDQVSKMPKRGSEIAKNGAKKRMLANIIEVFHNFGPLILLKNNNDIKYDVAVLSLRK